MPSEPWRSLLRERPETCLRSPWLLPPWEELLEMDPFEAFVWVFPFFFLLFPSSSPGALNFIFHFLNRPVTVLSFIERIPCFPTRETLRFNPSISACFSASTCLRPFAFRFFVFSFLSISVSINCFPKLFGCGSWRFVIHPCSNQCANSGVEANSGASSTTTGTSSLIWLSRLRA